MKTYTIYWNTRDIPHRFSVRAFTIGPKGPVAGELLGSTVTLEAARALIPPFLVCLARDPRDDQVIVETWI